MAHEHAPAVPGRAMDTRLWMTVGLNSVITVVEVAGGLVAGSLALLADAAHNLTDVAAVVLALAARRLARRPPTVRHTYGFKRAEVIAALANALVLIAVTALIAREGLHRLLHPAPVAQGIMLAVALVALAANAGSVFLLRRHDEDDVNVRSAFLHLLQDSLASLAVVIAALLAHTEVGLYVDPVAAIAVGLAVLHGAVALVWETLSTLLEGAPGSVDLEDLVRSTGEAFAPACLHHVHLWQNGPGQRLLTAHVALGRDMDGAAIEALFAEIKAFVRQRWGVTHATLEPEVTGCGETAVIAHWHDEHGDEHIG